MSRLSPRSIAPALRIVPSTMRQATNTASVRPSGERRIPVTASRSSRRRLCLIQKALRRRRGTRRRGAWRRPPPGQARRRGRRTARTAPRRCSPSRVTRRRPAPP
jgi:hypothetical protein